MKKLLALVLALVMTLGLATVGANAAYGDQDEISFKEAVGVMSALGVFKGNENGDFLPKANLDRASAAKLIAYLDLGAERAEAMPADQKFDDVPASHWAAKYIAYCATEGYISGAGDGNFYPASELTGYAFGKMLLCVLGYNAKAEGYEGSDWTIAVAKQMGKLKLANGVSSPASAVLTREEAAQYCLNALQLETVEYPNGGLTVSSGDVTIEITGGSAYGTGDTLADELFPAGLEKDEDSEDAFGRPATEWTLDGDTIGLFAQEPTLTYTSAVAGKKIYTDLNKKFTGNAAVIEDGDDEVPAFRIASDNDDTIGGQGTLTEVYKDGNAVTIVEINTYIAKITNWVAATADAKEYITVDGKNFETDEFSSADKNKTWVLYTVADGEIQTVVVPEKVEGVKVTKYNTSVNVTAGGKLYKLAAQSLEAATEFSFTTVYNLYLDTYGNLMMAVAQSEEEVIPSDFLYVEKVQAKAAVSGDLGGGASDRWAKAVVTFVDGTHQTVDLKITKVNDAYNVVIPHDDGTVETFNLGAASYNGGNIKLVGNWFAYTVKDGAYTLTPVNSTYGLVVGENITLTKNQVYRNGQYYTNSATKVVTIGDAAHNYAVVTKTGLVDATLNAKVLITYAKDKKNIAAFYAMTNPEAVVEQTTYAYAVEKGGNVADGTEWTFAIDGAQVTKTVATGVNVAAGKVYDLTEEDGVVTAATELTFDATNVVLDVAEATFVLAGDTTYYFATGYQVYNVDADTATVKGETATLENGDTVNLFLDGGKIAAAFIVDRADD